MKVNLGRALLIGVLLVFCVLPQNAAAFDKSKLIIWSTLTQESRAKALEKIAQDYQKEHPGVTVEIDVIGWTGAFDKMVAAISAGNPPDLAFVGQGWPQSLAATGGIVTVDDVISRIGGPGIFLGTSLNVLGSLEGKAYSIPIYVTPHIISYRKSWLAEVGKKPFKTWEEMYDVAKAVTNPAKNRYGYTIPFSDIHGGKPVWGFLLANGVTIFEKDSAGKWKLNIEQPAAVETYAFLYKLIKDTAPQGAVSYNVTDLRNLVTKGVLLGMYDTPEVLDAVKAAAPEMLNDTGFTFIPARKRLGASQGWVGLSVFEKGNQAVAKDFSQFLFQGSRLVDYCLSYPAAMFSPVEADYKSPRYLQGLPDMLKPILPLAPEILKYSAGISQWNGANPWAGEIENKVILPNALNEMLTKGITAEQAVKRVADQLRQLMGE